MTTVQERPAEPVWDRPEAPDPERIPAYLRTGMIHSGIQPFEGKDKLGKLLTFLEGRNYTDLHKQLHDLIFEQEDPNYNGTLTEDQARLIAKMARKFIRDGETMMKNVAELALNANGLLLDEVLPVTIGQSIQADQEARRMQELKFYFHKLSPEYDLPF